MASGTIKSVVPRSDIVNNLTTNDSTKVLSAAQGKALNEQIGNVGNYIGMIIKGTTTVANNTAERTYTISKSDFNSDVGQYLIIATEWSTGGGADVYLVTYSGGETTYCAVNRITNVLSSVKVTVDRSNGTFTVIGSHACYIMRRV